MGLFDNMKLAHYISKMFHRITKNINNLYEKQDTLYKMQQIDHELYERLEARVKELEKTK